MKLQESLRKAGWRQDWKPPELVRGPSKFSTYSYFTKKFSTIKAYVRFESSSFFYDADLRIPALRSTPEYPMLPFLQLTPDDHVPTVAEIEEEAKTRIAHHLSHRKKRDRISEISTWVDDDDDFKKVTGKAAFDLWKKKVEGVLREAVETRKSYSYGYNSPWFTTESMADDLFAEGGYNLLEYPITREMGSKAVRQILEKLAKEGVIDKAGGPRSGTKGGQYMWRAL